MFDPAGRPIWLGSSPGVAAEGHARLLGLPSEDPPLLHDTFDLLWRDNTLWVEPAPDSPSRMAAAGAASTSSQEARERGSQNPVPTFFRLWRTPSR